MTTPRIAPLPVSAGRADCWNAAVRNTAVSSPSRITAKNAIPTSARPEPRASAPSTAILEVAAEIARVAAHPDDHVGDCGGRDERDERLELLLADLGQVLVEDLQRDPEADAEEHGHADAGPHRAQRVPAAGGGEEGGDDDDDQRRLEALAEADHEGRQHALALREMDPQSRHMYG